MWASWCGHDASLSFSAQSFWPIYMILADGSLFSDVLQLSKKKKKRFYCCHSIFHVEERWDPEWKRGPEKHMCTSVKNDNTSILTSIKEKRNYILGSFHISFIQSVFNSLLHPAYLRNKDIRGTWRGSLPFINIDWYSHCSFSLEKITPKNCKRKN